MTRSSLPISQEKIQAAHLPVQYEEACKSLAACVTIDEAQYWSDKSDALAAWARIYRSDRAAVEARRLKLHAYRRMGQLAAELRPNKRRFSKSSAYTLLRESGLTKQQAGSARTLANQTEEAFQRLVDLPRPPAPISFFTKSFYREDTTSWRHFQYLVKFRQTCRAKDPKEIARGFTIEEANNARPAIREVQEWLDTLEQYLPKSEIEQ